MALGEFPNVISVPNPDKPGTFRNRKVLQICDSTAAEAIVAAFNRAATTPDFTGLLIDRDHESSDSCKTSDAWGWAVAMENRADGIWVKPRWTDLGEPAIKNGRFRFLSPVFPPEGWKDLGNNRIRPTIMDSIALTNQPNIRPLHPLSNRAAEVAVEQTTPAQPGRKESVMDYKAELLKMLGLNPDAADADITAKIAAQAGANDASMEEYATMKNRAITAETKLVALETAELERHVSADLEEFKSVIVDPGAIKPMLLSNRDQTRKLLAGLKAVAPISQEPLRNRATPPAQGAATGTSDAEAKRFTDQKMLVEEIKLKNRCTYTEAYSHAVSQRPDLFRSK